MSLIYDRFVAAGRQEVTQKLVRAVVTFRLDYCNSLLAGPPNFSLEPFKRVHTAAARLCLAQVASVTSQRAESYTTALVACFLPK